MSGEIMTFPETVEEFMEQYKIVDREHIYTNGAELVPVYRMKQWFEHQSRGDVPDTNNGDTISRQAAIDVIDKIFPVDTMRNDYTQGITCGAALAKEYIKQLPSAQPELIEQAAYVRGFEQGRTQGMIDAQSERKKGKWIVIEAPDIYVCPFCKMASSKKNFCATCGADMRGGDAI